ncbi:uncharacterized protein LOC124675651 isoform X2 [Lolium rigidum]|uniref:uncharacterized protein LOC124675651 isoform X2 n=1 Tax=Lolium rigidum TaxID=89674 RepID=UPI001F5CF46B|nr:uncharacterized protein LOC124675651 isoform X2 [Lolium rigidum]
MVRRWLREWWWLDRCGGCGEKERAAVAARWSAPLTDSRSCRTRDEHRRVRHPVHDHFRSSAEGKEVKKDIRKLFYEFVQLSTNMPEATTTVDRTTNATESS